MTLKSFRAHIGIYGKRNVGKSSFINALAKQEVAIVSQHAGTTTDPVKKTMELTGIGPVVLIDTAGVDDVGELGLKRVEKTYHSIQEIDLAIILLAGNNLDNSERIIIKKCEESKIPFFFVHHKSDEVACSESLRKQVTEEFKTDIIDFSSLQGNDPAPILQLVDRFLPESTFNNPTVLGDLVGHGDIVLLVTPIDIEAPKGRLILPQVQTIRDALDHECIVVMVKERELETYWKKVGVEPKLVVTDSQAFLKVDAAIPSHIPLTSFSILFARLKGDFETYIEGTRHIGTLKEGDNVLIFESCSHHVAQDDIGRVKIPRWLSNYTGKKLNFEVVAGLDLPPRPLEEYKLVVQCGGCMMTKKQIMNRLRPFGEKRIPITNYGMCISYCHGIFERAIKPFGIAHQSTSYSL